MGFVFPHLELDPFTLWVSIAVILGQECLSLVHLSIRVEPARRLGNEPGEEENESREHHLEPDWKDPRNVSSHVDSAAGCSTGNDGTDRPEDIIECSNSSTVCGVGDLNDVTWSCGGHKLDTHSHEETATHELVNIPRRNTGALDDDANDDDSSSKEHAKSSAPEEKIST